MGVAGRLLDHLAGLDVLQFGDLADADVDVLGRVDLALEREKMRKRGGRKSNKLAEGLRGEKI